MKQGKRLGRQLLDIVVAVVLAVSIFFFSGWVTTKAHSSDLLTQSRVLRMLVSDDSVGLVNLLGDGEKQQLTQRFIAALTNAYVSFELIPINEGETFTALIKSHEPGVWVEDITYQGRNLTIQGRVDQSETFALFLENLMASGRFAQVDGQLSENKDFAILCVAIEADFQGFFGGNQKPT